MLSLKRKSFLELYKSGKRSPKVLERLTKLSLSTVKRYLKKMKNAHSIAEKSRSGRPRKIAGSKVKSLTQKIRHNPSISGTKLATNYKCSATTVRRTLKKLNYRKSLPSKIPKLSAYEKKNRVDWSKRHLNDDWRTTIFIDESCMQLQSNTIRFWHKRGKPVRKEVPKQKKKVIFWGAFNSTFKFPLYFIEERMNSKKYCQILSKNLLPLANDTFSNFRILQDNDPKHNSEYTMEWLDKNGVSVLSIPAYSPDFNPIENLWRLLKLNVEKRNPQTIEELKAFLLEEWQKIPMGTLQSLEKSMRNRCEAVIHSKGERISY
jgi:transposase